MNYFKSRLNLRTTHDVNGARALASRPQASGGATGGLAAQGAVGQPGARRARGGRARRGAGPAAGAAWLAGRAAGAADGFKPI